MQYVALLTSGDSSERMTAPLVSTWMTLAEGNEELAMSESRETREVICSRLVRN